jgi:hypothetical protein
MDDYAVVVGVAQYPELSAAGIATNLDGPNNDATAGNGRVAVVAGSQGWWAAPRQRENHQIV